VARDWADEPALQEEALELDSFGRWFLARGQVQLCWEENFDWRGDVRQAGGGVLLHQGYELIDLLVQLMGLPDSVYSAMANVSRPGGRYSYDTEDTAAVICRFTGGAVATLHACWTVGPDNWSLELFGTQGTLIIEREQVVTRDRSGLVQSQRQTRGGDPLAGQIESFLAALGNPPPRFSSTLRQHLPAMAVMQAAYLSARTGQPESPSRIFEMHDINETSANG
ncbi:MAG: Gfo/Idh/MocA family oxidoreductase, partial [Phycisphaerales bacterium]|nr:Gfo/Idh/MocA family oxidoreductase [Phycisphaerales bacterium]